MGTSSALSAASIELSVQAVSLYKWLVYEKKEHIMSKQFLRSSTSIGANIHEAYYAASKADFINKMQIALKEASETDYWLIVLERTGYFDPLFSPIKTQVNALKKMLIATLNTAKGTE
ncbi:MAG: four helix bundle protein [Oscillospiraceae bacterium]|nr:four helix bundle protein [Oscillospiraceae bacterium]